MSLNYAYNISTSLFFALTVGLYFKTGSSWSVVVIEAVLNLLCLAFSLSCTFADPGIITLKTHLMGGDEELSMPSEKIVAGSDFYMFFKQETLLLHVPT